MPSVTQDVMISRRDNDLVFTHNYDAALKDEASDDLLMSVRAVYELALYSDEPLPDEFAQEYAQRQLHIVTRPYFRELVSSCAARSLIQVPPLPTQFVPPIPKKNTLEPSVSERPALKVAEQRRQYQAEAVESETDAET